MSRLLVTGATGFVGRNLCRALVARGHEVTAAVRQRTKSDGLPSAVRRVETGDLAASPRWEAAKLEEIDTIIHLAARVHVLRDTAADPLTEFRRVNVLASEMLARAAAGRVKRLIYASSLHAMCTLCDEPLSEDSPSRPDSPYGRSKLEAEERLRGIAARDGLELVVLRPPPVYGPEGQGNLIRLLRFVGRGWPLPLGGVKNRRSLIYVQNLVDALIACAEHPAAAGHTLLASDGDDLSTPELAHRAARAFGRRARLVSVPTSLLRMAGRCTGKSSAVDRLLGSLSVRSDKIRGLLGWRPPVSVDEGLQDTVRWIGKAA